MPKTNLQSWTVVTWVAAFSPVTPDHPIQLLMWKSGHKRAMLNVIWHIL